MKAAPPRITKENIALVSRRVRRKFIRAYLKMHGVPRPLFQKISEKITFNRLNQITMIEDLKKDAFDSLPKMNVLGGKL